MAQFGSIRLGDGELATLVSDDGERAVLLTHVMNPRGGGGVRTLSLSPEQITQVTNLFATLNLSQTQLDQIFAAVCATMAAGEWGVAPLNVFGSDSTIGAPIYCDTNNQLRTVPDHTNLVATAAGNNWSLYLSGGEPLGEYEFYVASATLTNTSARDMLCDVQFRQPYMKSLGLQDTIRFGAKTRYAFNAALAGAPTLYEQTLIQDVLVAGGQMGGGMFHYDTVTLAPGEYLTLEVTYYAYLYNPLILGEVLSANFGGSPAIVLRGFTV